MWEEAGFKCDFKWLHWVTDNMYPPRKICRELCDRNGIIELNTKGNAEQMNSWNEGLEKGLNQKQDGKFVVKC